MCNPPGCCGLPMLGDQSLTFYNDPIGFVNCNIDKHKSRIFTGRLLNKPSIFVCSNQGVRAVLSDNSGTFQMGYKEFMDKVYDDNLLYKDNDEARLIRERMTPLYSEEALQAYQADIDRIAEWHIACVNIGQQLELYTFFKSIITEIILSLFLGIHFETEADKAERAMQCTLKHWRGLVSVPVNVKLPMNCFESPFCKAMAAKKELKEIIKTQRGKAASLFVRHLESVTNSDSEEGEDFINNHVLLFSSALVPKALASLLTSFAIHMGQPEMVPKQRELLAKPEKLRNTLKEVERLCPPFIGGRRVVSKDVVVDNFKIPQGHAVVLMTYAAHRDPKVFSDPDTFRPERWTPGKGLSDDNLFVFGQGPRRCMGHQLIQNILKTVIRLFVSNFQWQVNPGQDTTFKYMPVARPQKPVYVNLIPQASHTSLVARHLEAPASPFADSSSSTSVVTEAISSTQI